VGFNKFPSIVGTMPKCNQCEREFATDEGLAQHMRDKHGIGKITKHQMKEQKKQEKEMQKEQDVKKRKSGKRLKTVLLVAVVILILAGIAYFFMTSKPSPNNTKYDLSGIPTGYIHWHSQVQVYICGERKMLPEPPPGGEIGSGVLHTHDKTTNIQSLPGTDGNGVMHIEGNVRMNPAEATLGKFMQNIHVNFGNETIMDKKNGDACTNSTNGTVKVFVNDKPLNNPLDYIARDKDIIRIEFS